MSLPQSLSRSLILDAPGNLFPNLQVNVSTSSFSFFLFQMNWRSRIRHPVWFIWRREISVDSASFRECTLTMPWRKRWVWGRVRRGVGRLRSLGGGGVCLPGAHSFHSLRKLQKYPLHTLGSSAELQHYVGDKNGLRAVA